ncbi:MAG: insulinase family protein [Planctomycetes bacterium]|nr:insulinase family protein [Planctomycetota bacterium]MCC7172964.1 insulinase family protein [Planctomycetota bacterium]
MNLQPIENALGEEVLAGTHDSGLRVVVVRKPGFSRTFGVFTTNYGSIDDRFVDPKTGAPMHVPDGVAHFLEHKMFEDERGDVSDRFSALGAMSNAFTSFTNTSYLFSTSSQELECLDLLLDFVQEPYFTPELVKKEQGIIGQEIRMYDDDPSWRIYFGLLQALFSEHPVRINIAGTEESIARIDPEVLFACHRAFYRPANMVLTLVGAIDPEAATARIDADLAQRRDTWGGTAHRRKPFVDATIRARTATLDMDVARRKLLLGFKEHELSSEGLAVERREIATNLVLELLFGRSSKTYERLYAQGLVDESFSAQYSGEFDFGFAAIGGDTDDPDRLEQELLRAADEFARNGPDRADLDRIRRMSVGRFAGQFNSTESVALGFASASMRDLTPFDSLHLLRAITPEEVHARGKALLDASRCARSVLEPRAESTS